MTDSEKLDLILSNMQYMNNDISDLKSDMQGVKSEISDLKSDMQGVKSEISDLKSDMQGVKSEISDLKSDMQGVKSEISDLKSDMQGVKSEISDLKSDMQDIKQQTSKIDNKLTHTNLTLENEIRTNIKRVAEGHLDLSRNLHLAIERDSEKEMLAIRVSVLESEMRQIKDRLDQTA